MPPAVAAFVTGEVELTGVVVRLMREARAALASRRLGMLDLGIEEAEVTDPQLVAAIQDLAAGRIGQLTPE